MFKLVYVSEYEKFVVPDEHVWNISTLPRSEHETLCQRTAISVT